jgi:D-tagatose-1,6-bisphosphate aldolase subunit GatZ/KbaZ
MVDEGSHEYLLGIGVNQHRGFNNGIASICSANPWVIEAAFLHELDSQKYVLVESTCNQVNQFGGYTGMTPENFVEYIRKIADKVEFAIERVIIGGDHLGPFPWQAQSSNDAMAKARKLVADCVKNKYLKIHLDASMRLADDEPNKPLDLQIAARRAAKLAKVAESTYENEKSRLSAPVYVIGTEVPDPGGIQGHDDGIKVTNLSDLRATIEITKEEFISLGLEEAWSRVIAVVVQPGVEYGDSEIFNYERDKASKLSKFIENYPNLVYEAHSTDYQTQRALTELVEDHFAILKVGPELTYAFREAVFALAMIEEEILSGQEKETSNIREILEMEMVARSEYWEKYYGGNKYQLHLARKFSFSDRIRYYWPAVSVQESLARLLQNLRDVSLPLSLVSQFFPIQYGRIRNKQIDNDPVALILDHIQLVYDKYSLACVGPQMNEENQAGRNRY